MQFLNNKKNRILPIFLVGLGSLFFSWFLFFFWGVFLGGASLFVQNFVNTLFTVWDFFLFWCLPLFIVGLSLGVIWCRNPIHNLFCLIGVFFNSILIFFSIRVEFLSLIFLIVYLGAIAILFLFVIMLLNLRNVTFINFFFPNVPSLLDTLNFVQEIVRIVVPAQRFKEKIVLLPLLLPVAFPLLVTLLVRFQFVFLLVALCFLFYQIITEAVQPVVYYTYKVTKKINEYLMFSTANENHFAPFSFDLNNYQYLYGLNDILLFSDLLYTEHWLLLVLSGMLLLAAMIGSIVLAMSTLEEID